MTTWAVTVYYNPQKFTSRYRNFALFRKSLNVPLLTVEWSKCGQFELKNTDSDILVSLSGGDLMWQKERLLNIAVKALPPECEVVAWLDHDVIFQDRNWVGHLEEAMAQASIVQLFSQVEHLPPNGSRAPLFMRESIVSVANKCGSQQLGEMISSLEQEDTLESRPASETGERARIAARPSSGHAWAARRTLLEEQRLYDACICGAGDMAIALAALGLPEMFPRSFPLNAAQSEHYLAWAEPFATAVNGNIAVLPSGIDHLFHGLITNRQYRSRMQWASTNGFDPARDLAQEAQGLWVWARERDAREAWMSQYFQQRLEDGSSTPP